jgi:tetratricopeptide (TPR) repeat protein
MGCGSSKSPPPTSRREETSKPVLRLPDPIPSPPPLLIVPKNTPPKFKPRQLPEKILEDFIIVWLNPSADNDPNTQNTEEQLQELVNVVITYTDPDECYAFIDDIKNEKIFLVVSGTTVEQFAPRVQEVSQIDSIYCLNSEEEATKIRIGNIPGIVGTFSTMPELCEKVEAAIKISGHNLVKPVFMQSKPERISFMYDQLFREIILNSEEGNLEELYQFCETHYSNNNKEKKYLTELRKTYSKEESIYWYTKEGCLYKVLNKALRTREYETLYELRDFIRHLHEQLVQLNKTEREIPILYRGQAMETAELDRIRKNKGEPTFFANFLSTSTNRTRAMWFAEESVKNPNDREKVKVLFEIKVDKNVYFPFAYIRELSAHKDEEEWLFSMGSVFRIDTTERLADNTELIRLTSMNDNDEQLAMLKEHFQNFVKDKNVCLNFARLMHQLAHWEGSRKFYQKSLDKETECYRQAAIYNNLGSIALELEKYDEALENYKQSLEIEQKEENSDYKDLASTYNNIGTVHHKKKEMDLAIENFERAIAAYNDKPNGDQELIATLYNNIATVLNHQGKHQQALGNNVKCLLIRERILPPLHPSLATAYNSIASTYHYLQFFLQGEEHASEADEYAQKAVDYAAKAVNIDNQALPSDHPQTKIHTENLERFTSKGTNSEQ